MIRRLAATALACLTLSGCAWLNSGRGPDPKAYCDGDNRVYFSGDGVAVSPDDDQCPTTTTEAP